MTCRNWVALLVAVCVALRFKRVSSIAVEGSLGIVQEPPDVSEWNGSEGNGHTLTSVVIYLLFANSSITAEPGEAPQKGSYHAHSLAVLANLVVPYVSFSPALRPKLNA
jgi:hypothetical protein